MQILVQHRQTDTLKVALQSHLHQTPIDSLHAAMAYVSVSGVRALLNGLTQRNKWTSQWLLGLDDCLTQPGAIDTLMSLHDAEVRVATLADISRRFHPKVLHFQSSKKNDLLMIGSANLTGSALDGNSEAVVFLETENLSDKVLFVKVWADLWSQGHKPSKKELTDYKKRYDAAKKHRQQAQKLTHKETRARVRKKPILEGDTAELDPSRAATCWIECGYITAMGRELELKAEQGLFFGLNPTGEKPKNFRFRTSDGKTVILRIKYQENHMWRLQMNNKVPEVQRGLRPRRSNGSLGRSNQVAVFRRTSSPNAYALKFLRLNSPAFTKLRTNSQRLGTVGHTSTRSYGWC